MSFIINVDQDVCVSSGKCVADAPGVFRFDEDEIAEVRSDPAELPDDVMVDLARNCPSAAIKLFDGDRELEL